MDPSTERQHSASKDSSKRIHRGDQRQRRHLCVNTDLLCPHNATGPSTCNSWICLTGDISTAFLHAAAATADLFMYPPAEFYNAYDQIFWRLNKAIYGLRSSPKAWQNHPAEVMQQLGLRRLVSEPNVYAKPGGDAYILCYVDDLLFIGHQERSTSCSRVEQHLLLRPAGRAHSRQHHQLFGQKHLQPRWLLRDQPSRSLHNRAVGRSQHAQLQPSTSTRQQHSESNFRDGTRTQQRRTCSLPKDGWQTTMDDIHNGLCNKGTRKGIDTANNSRPTETETPTQVHQGGLNTTSSAWDQQPKHQQLKQHQTSRSLSTVTGPDVPQESRQQAFWSKSLEQQSTTAPEHSQQLRWAARKQNYTRSTQEQQKLYTSATSWLKEALNMKKINIRIHIYLSSGKSMATAKHIELKHLFIQQLVAHDLDCQGQHRQQPGRHLHQVRCNRDASASHQWCWDQHTSSLSFQTTTSNSFTAASALICERVHIVRTSCVACTHIYTSFWAMVSTKVDNMNCLIVIPLYFNMEYINKIFIQYFNVIFDMCYFNMNVDYMMEYKHVSYTTCLWYTTCLFVQDLRKPNSLKNSTFWCTVFVDVNILLTTVKSTPLVHRSRDIFNKSVNFFAPIPVANSVWLGHRRWQHWSTSMSTVSQWFQQCRS